jgi:hypothetical protein
LGGDLELVLLNGFVPNPSDTILIFSAGFSIFNSFANVANGQRLTTTDGLGSFIVNYGAGSAFDPRQIVLSSFVPAARAAPDLDADGDVDGDDLTLLASCKTRDRVPHSGTPTCQAADFDADGDADGDDFGVYQRCFSGANVPADPACAG